MENISDRYRLIKGGDRPSLYCIMNTDTKRWWWHKRLREQGKHKEARALERKCIRGEVQQMRQAMAKPAAYCTTNGGKHTFHYDENCYISGYDAIGEGDPLMCRILGIPTADLSTVDFSKYSSGILAFDDPMRYLHELVAAGAIAYNLPAALLPSA